MSHGQNLYTLKVLGMCTMRAAFVKTYVNHVRLICETNVKQKGWIAIFVCLTSVYVCQFIPFFVVCVNYGLIFPPTKME